jgi:hypothetical protein
LSEKNDKVVYMKKRSEVCIDWINSKCYNYYCNKKHYIDNMYKRSICKHWKDNKCQYPSNICTYAHGEYDKYDECMYYNNTKRERSRSRSPNQSRDKLKLRY